MPEGSREVLGTVALPLRLGCAPGRGCRFAPACRALGAGTELQLTIRLLPELIAL